MEDQPEEATDAVASRDTASRDSQQENKEALSFSEMSVHLSHRSSKDDDVLQLQSATFTSTDVGTLELKKRTRRLSESASMEKEISRAYRAELILASLLASQDFSGAQRAWRQFVDLISHPEPTLRKAAIINIGGLFRKFPMWDVLSPRDAQGFVTALLDTVVGDEIIDIRLHAAKVLGSTLTISNYAAAAAAVGMFRRVSKARLPGSSAISDDQSQRKRIRIFVVEFIAQVFNASAFPQANETRYWCFRPGTRPTQQLVAVVTSFLGPVIQFEQPEARLRCRAGILFVAYELLASREQLSPLVVANLLKMLEAESDLLVSQNDETDNASDFDFVDAEDADAFFEGDFACSDTLDVDLGLLQFCALFVPLMQDLLHDYKEDRRVEKAILTFLGIWASVFSRMDALEVRFRAAELRKECVTGFGNLLGPRASRYEGFTKALAAADQEYAKLKVEVRRRVEAVRSVLQRPGTVVQLFAQKSDEAATASSIASHESRAPVFASRTHGLADRICGIESMAMPVPTSERALVRVALRIPELPEVPENCTTVPPMLFRPGTERIPVCTSSMLKTIPDLQDMAELGYSPYPPPSQGTLKPSALDSGKRATRPSKTISSRHTSLPVRELEDIEQDDAVQVNPADIADPDETSAQTYGYLRGTRMPAGFLATHYKNGAHGARRAAAEPSSHANGWEPPSIPFLDADSEDHDSCSQDQYDDLSRADSASTLNSLPDTTTTIAKQQEQHLTQRERAGLTSTPVPIVSAYHHLTKTERQTDLLPSHPILPRGEIEIWITETLQDPIRRFLGVIAQVEPVTSMQPVQHSSQNAAGGQPRYDGESAGSDDSSEDSAALTSALGSSESGEPESAPIWTEDDRVEIRFRTSNGDMFAATVMIAEALEDDQDLEMWGSDRDEQGAEMARSNPVPAALCGDGKVLFAPPCNFPPMPIVYKKDSGLPLYGAARPLRKRPVACTSDGIFAFAGDDRVTQFERPLVYSNSGHPFYRLEGGMLPLPAGYTSTGVPFYTVATVILHPFFSSVATRKIMARQAFRASQRKLQKRTSKLIRKLQVAAAFMQRGSEASLSRASVADVDGQDEETKVHSEGISTRRAETKDGTAQKGLGLMSDEKRDTKVVDGPNNEDESEEGEEDEFEGDDNDDLILGTFVGGDTESFSQLSSESSERGTSSTSLMAALYSADPSEDPANGRKTVPILFDRAVIEFTHTTTEETCKVKVQTKFAPKRDLDVFVMLDPPEVFEVVPAVLRFSPVVTSISLDIVFRPQRHTEKSSSVQGEIRVQEFSGQVLGTADLCGFCGPAFEVKSMLRRPLWIGPGQQTTFIVAVSNVTPRQLDVAIKIIANTDDVEDDTYETDENLAFAADIDSLSIFKFQEAFVPVHFVPGHFTGLHEASLCVTSNTGETHYLPLIGHCGAPIVVRGLTRQEQAIYAADPTDKTKAPVTLTRKRRSTLRAMDLEAPPTLSTLVDALEGSTSETAGGGATTKASNTTGPGRRNMNAFVKKPWAQVRKLMGGLGGFRVQRRIPYDRPQDRPQENVPFLEELARTAVNYSVVGKSLQAADPKLTLRYRLQEHDDKSDGDSDDESSVDSGPEWVNFDAHAKLDVDFGLVDPFQVIKRKFIIENMTSELSLVSLTLRGCPWIKMPNLLEVPPCNQAIVDLELSGPGDWTGAFDFVIEITSMILRAPLQVRLIGFVGRALEFPLAPRTFFGISAPSGKPVTLSLPVVNHSPYELQFVLLPLGTHFTAAISSDPSTKTKISALGCAWIEVSFSPGSFRGIYRSLLGVRVLHPVSITYAAAGPCGLLELVGLVAAPSGPQVPGDFDLNRIAALEAWIQETNPSSFVGPAGGSLDFARKSGSVSQHTSELCRLCDQDLSGENRLTLCAKEGEPFSWHVVGRSSENLPFVHTHLGDYTGTSSKVVVEASIIAEDDSKLSVFASRGLVAESLGPSRALIKPENSVSDYPLRFGLVGVKHHLTVDDFPSHVSGILVCQEGPISFNILPREGRTPVVNFGNCLAGASSRRWVTIRNWSSKPVRFVLDLGDMEDRFGYAPVQIAGQDQEGYLAPFAACFVPLTFKPESEGQLREMARVQAFSAKTYGQVQGRDAKPEHSQEWAEKHVWASEIALVGNALVEAIHGLPEADELFDFGAVPVDSMTTRVWEPRNKGTTVQKLTFNVNSPFTVSPALVTLEPEESAQVTISFHATTAGSYLQELTCMANGKPMVFPLRGIVGELKASASTGPSGLISYGTRKTDTISSAFVTITNKGSLPLELSRVIYIGSPDLAWQLRKFQIFFAGILPSYTETGQKVHIIERKHAWAILRRRLAHALRITRNKSVEAGMSSLTSQKNRMSMSRKSVYSRSSFKNSTIVYKVSGRAGLDSGFLPSQSSKLQSSKRFQPLQQPSFNHKLARRQNSKILPASSMRSHESRPGQMSMKRASPQLVSQEGSSGYLLGQSSHLLHPDKAAALMNAHADAELERFAKNGNTLIPIVPEIPSSRVFRPSAAIAKSIGSDVVDPEDTLPGRAKASTLPELPPLKPGDSYLFRINFEGKLCVPLSVPVKLHFGPWQVSEMRMDLGLGDAEIVNVKDCSKVLRFEGNAVRRLDLKPDVLAFKPTPAREHFPPDVLPEGNVLHIVATNASPHTLTFNCARCNNLSFEIPDKMIVVQPGSSVTVPIRFRPIHANTDYHANLALEDMFGRRNIRLSGRGAAAKVEAVTDVVRFPAVKIGKSATSKFILRNAGLFKSQIHISCNSEYFSLSQESFILGASGGTEPTIVTCALPSSARHSLRDTFAVEASLEVRWQLVPGGNWTTWLIPVSAEIGTVIFEADAVECDLGLVTLNCASQASFRLRNLGTAPCEWTALQDMINAASGDCLNVELSAFSGEIGAGQVTVLTIQFEPRTCDLLELVVPIESDGGNLALRICGTVVAPQIVVPKDLDMDFGVILLEKRMQKGFKVENVGRIPVDVRAQLFIHNHTLEGSRKAKASRIVSMWGSSQEGATPTKVAQSAIRGRITELRHETSADREEALPDPNQADFVRGACFALGPVEAHLEPGESVTTVLEAFGDPSLPGVQSEAVNVIGSWVITAKQLVDVEWKGRLRARIGKLDANVEVPALLEGSRPREISAQDGALYSYFGVCMVNCEFLRRAACELVNHGTVNIEFLIEPEPRDMTNGDDSQEPVFEIQPRAGQLAPGERISIDVVFLAQTEGFHRLVTDVRFRPTGSAASSGGERLEQVVFCATSGVPRLVCLVGELNYGRCQIDGKPMVQTFQLQSAGNCPVSWSAKIVKGAEHFSLECLEGIISPQDDVLVPVKFSPRGACMREDEDLLACTGLLLVEWAGQTPFEIELCGEGARGRLEWSVEGETSEEGIQFGTQPIHAGCHPAWRSVHLRNEGQLGLDVIVRADLDGSVFAICSREDERRQRDMEMQIERRFAQAELQQTLSGGALQVSRLMTQQALKTNSAARSIGDQNSKFFENEPVADRDMEDLSRLSSTDPKSAFMRKFHLTPGDVAVLHVGFAPIAERTHQGELEIGIAGVSGCEQHILVGGSGGEFRIVAEQAMQIDSVGVGFTTLDTLTLRNTGKLPSQVEVTVDPPEVGQQMTFTVEEVFVQAEDAHTRTRPMHETEMMHQKAHEAGIHHSQFSFHGESTVRLLVGFLPTNVGQLSGALLIRPLHEGLDDAEDLLATSSRVRAKETAGTRRQNVVGPFGLVIPFSIDAVNNRLRLLRTSNVAMGRLACGQTCTDIRLLANGTDMEIDFSVRFSRQDAAWSVSPESGTLGPGTQVELHITFTTPREGESNSGKRDHAIDVDDWHEVEIEVLNETTGARDVCIRGYGAAGFPALQTNLDGQNRVDFGACQLNSAVSVPIVFRNVGTGMLHVQPRIEYESKEDHEQVIFIGWERPNSTHRDRSLPAQLDMAVGRSPEQLAYAKSLGNLLSHTGDGMGEGIDQPIFTGFGVLEPGAELRMMITFSPRFRGEVAAKLVIATNAERGRGGGASEVSLTGAGHSFDLHMDLLTNRIHFGTWMLGQSHTIKIPLRRRGDENVPVKLLFDNVRYERAWTPPFGCGGILSVGEGTTGKANPEPLQHDLGHVRLSSAEVDVSGSETTEENVDEVELELSVPSSWLDNKQIPKRESIEAFRTLINAQPAPPANSTVSLFLLRPGSLPPYQIDVMFSFKFPRIAVELSEPVASDGEKDRILIRDLGEIGRPGESVLAGLSEKDRSHVGAVIRFGSVLTRQAVAKSFVLSSDSPLRIPFKAQIEVQKHANSTENYNAFFSLSRKEGVLEAEEPMAIKLRCNFSIPFDATHNPALVRIQFLHGALPEMIIPIDVRTMDHVFSAVHLAPVRFVEPVFVGRAEKGILRLANVTGDPVEANINFGDSAFSLGGGLLNPVKVPAQEEPMEIVVHFLPSEDAAYDSSIDIQVDKMVFSVGISGIGSRAGLKLKPTNCVDFGFVGAMLRGNETLAVRNTSALPLLVEVDCAGIGGAWLDARPRHFTLKARSSQMVQLEFLPTKEASYDGALVVRGFEAESDMKEKDSSMKLGSGALRRRQLVEETVRVAGVGGRVSLAFPEELNFGRISTHIRQAAYLELANKGDVAMDVRLVARDVDGIAVVKFVPSELALLPGQSVDVNVLLTLQLDQEQSFWIDILPVVADAQDFGMTASNPYSWSLRVAAFGDKIDLSEEMQRILAEERLPKLSFRSDDVEDEHLRHVLRPVVQLPQASFAHLLRPVEPSLDAASVQFQNALARPAPLVSEIPQHATRPKWHENRAPLKLERSSRETAAQALSTSYTFSNARWKALFAGGGDDDDDDDRDHDNSGSRGRSGPHEENSGIQANHARRK